MSATSNANSTDKVTVLQGEVLFAEGGESGHLYIIISGQVQILKEHKGRLVSVAKLGEKEFVGEVSMFGDERRSASAIAATDCFLVRIPRSEVSHALAALPPWVGKMMQTLSDRLRKTSEILRDQNITGTVIEGALSPQEETTYMKALVEHRKREGAPAKKK